mmetsp:Transcript_14825/g.22546  ORF Transcript_14825/g.22546 Transcript_14825/m.22546 type:complete len:94 (+) Transcript_14825:339-620(+)
MIKVVIVSQISIFVVGDDKLSFPLVTILSELDGETPLPIVAQGRPAEDGGGLGITAETCALPAVAWNIELPGTSCCPAASRGSADCCCCHITL